LFWLKITSSGRGALADTRCVQLNSKNMEWTSQQSSEVSEKTTSKPKEPKSTENLSKEAATYEFLGPLVGEHWEKSRRRPRISRLPDCLRHVTLDLVRRWEDRRSHSPRPGGSVGHHLTKTERPPPKRHDSSCVVLPNDSR
jgi:hypothetical protein